MRAASSDWIVGRHLDCVGIDRQLPPAVAACRMTRSSTSMRTSSPNEQRVAFGRRGQRAAISPAGSRSVPSRPVASCSVAASSSPSSVTTSAVAAPDLHRTLASTRVALGVPSATSNTGVAAHPFSQWSSRSSSNGSAHWMSSITSTSGRPEAADSISRRIAQNVSSTDRTGCAPPLPTAPRSTDRGLRSSLGEQRGDACPHIDGAGIVVEHP